MHPHTSHNQKIKHPMQVYMSKICEINILKLEILTVHREIQLQKQPKSYVHPRLSCITYK